MKSINKSNEVSKSELSFVYLVAALVLAPAPAAAETNQNITHHRFAQDIRRPAPSAPHRTEDPPFSFACTTDGGYRLGCESGWIY
jgi:hypothetical protein